MTDNDSPAGGPDPHVISKRRLPLGNGPHSTMSGAPRARPIFAARRDAGRVHP
jgi:hypothetical protein